MTDATCAAADRCAGYTTTVKPPRAALIDPGAVFCDPDLAKYERDTRALVYDYLDLAQLQSPALSQALNTQPAGKPAPPMPLNGAAEALQAEILYTTTAWEIEVRAAAGLPDPDDQRRARAAPWHTTTTNPPPLLRVRPGAAVQRAVRILAPRLRVLAALPPVTMSRTGDPDAGWEDIPGHDAVLHLAHLHQRARGMLGRTRRTTTVPGACSAKHPTDPNPDRTCDGVLYRDEPRYPGDPCDAYCGTCRTTWTHDEYERFVSDNLLPVRTRP